LEPGQLKFSENPAFIYYCDNETVNGIEMPSNFVDSFPVGVPVVCDMSSNIASRPVDVSKYAIIYAGAQKNIGPAGVTIVIVRDDLLGRFDSCPLKGPLMLSYKLFSDNNSLYNTPPSFSIYVTGLVFRYLLDKGELKLTQEDLQQSPMKMRLKQKHCTSLLTKTLIIM
jgi:phosphoserine aminotransferase